METAEEPQKKIFKARKTMKTSDRQQLEVIHKAKEDFLKPTELKLVTASRENGDSDMNSIHNETDSFESKSDINGILDINCDNNHVKVNLADLKEGLTKADQVSDLISAELHPPQNISCEDNTIQTVSGGEYSEDVQTPLDTDDTKPDEDISVAEADDPTASEELSSSEKLSLPEISPGDAESSEGHVQPDIPLENESLNLPSPITELEDVNPVVNSVENECTSSETPEGLPSDDAETPLEPESEVNNVESPKEEAMDCENEHSQDDSDKDFQKEEDEKELVDSNIANSEEAVENIAEDNGDAISLQEPPTDMDVAESDVECSEKNIEDKTEDVPSPKQDIGEEAISSSMEVDNPLKSPEPAEDDQEASLTKTVSESEQSPELKKPDTMETEEIIPILEKLAPVQDDVQNIDKPVSPSENTIADDEKVETSSDSPTKNEANTSLPSEAFLVLSDEEEACEKPPAPEVSSKEEQDSCKPVTPEPPVTEDIEEAAEEAQESACNTEAVKSESHPRKRSKSEDFDTQCAKRRRFDGEEYEAELKVKITAEGDLNEKLQKVIQRMFEDKLSALQCADFDKAISDLKSRVERIECKKHENVLQSIQAKISRLTRRFGAAKEDFKKRPEIQPSPANPLPLPDVKPAITETPVSSSNPNAAVYRSTSTVRQILDSRRHIVETTSANVQMSTTVTTTPTTPSSNIPLRPSTTPQVAISQLSSNSTLQTRAPPDWKLIQQKINAQNTQSTQPKPNPPVTSPQVIPSVLSTSNTATVVGNTQVSSSSNQPMSVSLQSLPVILHVPVAMQSQSQILQGTTGTLVTNQQSGNVEFIPSQNQSTASNLTKTPVSIPVTKTVNSPSLPSPGIQRNSPATSVPSTMAVQAIPSSHSVALSSRQSLPPVVSSGTYNQTNNRNITPMKSPVSGFTNPPESAMSRTDLQTVRTPVAAEPPASKRTSDGNAQGGRSGVIDLTLDDEDPEVISQDTKRTIAPAVSTNVQPPQTVSRQVQPPQMNNPPSTAPAGLSSQATIHVLPTAQTTVNVTQRPGTQMATRPPAPRPSHMVYTTTSVPTSPAQTPVRNTTMQSQNLRQMTPQTGGVPVRMPQVGAYVVNNGNSGPQLTVHHRPPQTEPARPIHPAPLPEAPQPQRLPPEAASLSPPQKPHLKLARVQSQNGIVLSWSVLEVDRSCGVVDSYHLYAYHEDPSATSPSQWKKIGEVKALPLPMACTLTQFVSGSKYYFAVRAKDVYGRFGPFCDPQSTDVMSTQSS